MIDSIVSKSTINSTEFLISNALIASNIGHDKSI